MIHILGKQHNNIVVYTAEHSCFLWNSVCNLYGEIGMCKVRDMIVVGNHSSFFFSFLKRYQHSCELTDVRGMNAASAFQGESEGNDLHLEPGKPRVYQFSFLPLKEDVGGQIEVGWTSYGSKNEIFCFFV